MTDTTWGGYENNVYYNPDKCGLTLIAKVEEALSWEYDMVIAVRDNESDKLYVVHDSGCSCPTPFEDVSSFSDMTEIRSVADAQSFVNSYKSYDVADKLAFFRKIQEALKEGK